MTSRNTAAAADATYVNSAAARWRTVHSEQLIADYDLPRGQHDCVDGTL